MNLLSLLHARRKRSALKRYILHLGPLLARTYGKAEHYSPKQVRGTLSESGLASAEAVYALVLYCTPEQFAADQAAHGETGEYWPLRVEIMKYDFRHGRDTSPGGTGNDLSAADHDALSG